LPFEKEQPSGDLSVRPPWEALVQAGPGAENDLDLETLDGPLATAPAIEEASDAQAADVPVSAPEPPPAPDRPAQKPAAKGPAIKSVAVPSVTGAKGKGNSELTAAMRAVLKEAGWPVLAGRQEDSLLITGQVSLAAPAGDSQTVKLVWTVAAPDGAVLGRIVQENQVEAGTLDQGFGETARYAAEGAAEGIFKLIQGLR
jgi:hypothetical protein